MTTIITRASKGSPLSWSEADANFTNLNDDKAEVSVVDLKAPLDSPSLTGVPTAPTAVSGTNTTQLATTAFVQGNLDSPSLTGVPTAPTAVSGTNTTQLATTAFVQGKTASQTPSTAVGNIAATTVQAALEELDTEKASLTGANFSGQVTATKLQTGVSGTNTNNFILDASAADGTMKLERGDGQDIMTVDATGKVAFPQTFDKLIGLVIFDGLLTGTNSPISGFGITSVTRNGVGNYTINLSSTYSDNAHIVSTMSDAGQVQAPQWIGATTNSINIGNYNQAGAPTDATRIMMTIHRVTS